MDSSQFWLWTAFMILLSFLLTRILCECYICYPSIRDRPYILFHNKDKEMMPIIKIESTNT